MKLKLFLPGLILLVFVATQSNAQIAKGTFSISTEYSLFNSKYDILNPEGIAIRRGTETREQISFTASYFPIKNFELGLTGYLHPVVRTSSGVRDLDLSWRIGPLVGYHLPLSRKFYLFTQAAFTLSSTSENAAEGYLSSPILTLALKAGLRYQFNDHFGIHLSFGPSFESAGKRSNSEFSYRGTAFRSNLGVQFLFPKRSTLE